MPDAVSTPSQLTRKTTRLSGFAARVGGAAPSLTDCGFALLSALLLIISFPDFNLWPISWLALVSLFIVIARLLRPLFFFCMGWLFSSVFFFGSCYWLTYSI